jgi:hypothetical protein
MRLTVFAATLAFLLWGTPAFAGSSPDSDGDGIADAIDNCSDDVNTAQDDTDTDDCGNVCDADYSQTGTVNIGDYGGLVSNFGGTDQLYCHIEPISVPPCTVALPDFGFVVANFGGNPGPSGSTAGTTACPSP